MIQAEKRSGSWSKRVYSHTDQDGKKHYKRITATTKAELERKMSTFKLTLKVSRTNCSTVPTLSQAIDAYIASKSAVLSPSTVTGYEAIARSHYQDVMQKPINQIDNWQSVVNEDAKKYSPKTVTNTWRFVATVLRANNIDAPDVRLPQIVPHPLPYLTTSQIPVFLEGVKGSACEMLALLALHGLRRSEIQALTKENCFDGIIHIRGAAVHGSDGLVFREANKNNSSRRDVPIMIPRLSELIDAAPEGLLVPHCSNWKRALINRVCQEASLPEVGMHGLRRSFASVGYKLLSERELMRLGGWADYKTMHRIYVQLSEEDVSDAGERMKAFYQQIL